MDLKQAIWRQLNHELDQYWLVVVLIQNITSPYYVKISYLNSTIKQYKTFKISIIRHFNPEVNTKPVINEL